MGFKGLCLLFKNLGFSGFILIFLEDGPKAGFGRKKKTPFIESEVGRIRTCDLKCTSWSSYHIDQTLLCNGYSFIWVIDG